ncbi:MAG: elongation factor Ts [Erysipelotrichaceae bacterium]|jgi:elongation factor Ts|nr:elongation factor Ts [Erysipelotrichaceae bacterium]
MADSLIDLIKVLRDRTGAGLMDCKGALLANDCDLDKATDWLREKGLAKAAKKADRIAAEGLALTIPCGCGNRVAILEVNCETDFVAKGEQFHDFVEAIGKNLLANNYADLEAAKEGVKDLVADATVKMGEKFDLRRYQILKKEDGQEFGTYLHMGGKIAVALILEGGSAELAKGLAMHIAANNPSYLTLSDVPADVLAHERDVQREASKNDPKFASKPAEFQEKILDGKLNKHFSEMTLAAQSYLMDDSKNVAQVLKDNGASIKCFVRYQVGEGIEKRQDDFASEVMKEINK